jgi:hypothetical protein
MWLPIGVAVIVVLILSTVALIDRRSRRYHVLRTGREYNADMREERRDARVIDSSGGLVIPPHEPRDRTPPDL